MLARTSPHRQGANSTGRDVQVSSNKLLVHIAKAGDHSRLLGCARDYADDNDLDVTLCKVLPRVERTGRRTNGQPILPWETMRNHEVAATQQLDHLRARHLRGRPRASSSVIRFGKETEQLASLAGELGVHGLMAARRPRRLFLLDRDAELQRKLPAPLLLVDTSATLLAGSLAPPFSPFFTPEAKTTALRRVPLFADLRRKELAEMAKNLDEVRVGAGFKLLEEGRRNLALWVIVSGSVEVTCGGRHVRMVEGAGLVGVPSMLDGGPAWATAITTSPVRALVASRAQSRALTGSPAVEIRLWADTGVTLRHHVLKTLKTTPQGA